jgi:hypothetical protein
MFIPIIPPIHTPSPPPEKTNYPTPSEAAGLVREDIVFGGDADGFPKYIKYVNGLSKDDIYSLRNLNNKVNTDVTRWNSRYNNKTHINKNWTMFACAVSTPVILVYTGVIYMICTAKHYDLIFDFTLGSALSVICMGVMYLNFKTIKRYIHIQYYETPHTMMNSFHYKYDTAFQNELDIRK